MDSRIERCRHSLGLQDVVLLAFVLFNSSMFMGCSRSVERTSISQVDNGLCAPLEVRLNVSEHPAHVAVFYVPLTNKTKKEVRVVGMKTNCSCAQSDLPATIGPGSTMKLAVQVAVGDPSDRELLQSRRVVFAHEDSQNGLSVDLVFDNRKKK